MPGKYLFSSESVTEGHPDKTADQISDSILDAVLEQAVEARGACETLVTTGLVLVGGEMARGCYVEIPKVARDTIRRIGWDSPRYMFEVSLLRFARAGHTGIVAHDYTR